MKQLKLFNMLILSDVHASRPLLKGIKEVILPTNAD